MLNFNPFILIIIAFFFSFKFNKFQKLLGLSFFISLDKPSLNSITLLVSFSKIGKFEILLLIISFILFLLKSFFQYFFRRIIFISNKKKKKINKSKKILIIFFITFFW